MAICSLQSNMTLKDTVLAASSYVGSLNYLKKMIPIAVSNILAQRVEYEKNCFNVFRLEDEPYHVFSSRIAKKHPLATVYHAILEAAELLEKKAINKIVLVISNGSETTPELFQFIIKHLDDQQYQKAELPSILKATVTFIKNINMLHSLKKLPTTVKVSIETTLNASANLGLTDLRFFKKGRLTDDATSGRLVKLGGVQTHYHSLRVTVNREVLQTDSSDRDSPSPEPNAPITDQLGGDFSLNDTLGCNSPLLLNEIIEDENEESLKYEGKISCLCKVLHPVGQIEMINCPGCQLYQHVACLGYKKASSVPQPYICYDCSKATKQKYQDVRMIRFKFDDQRRALALIRLFSYACVTYNMCADALIKKISPIYIKKSAEDMQKFGIVIKVLDKYVSVRKVMDQQLQGRYYYKESDSQTFDSVLNIESSNEKI